MSAAAVLLLGVAVVVAPGAGDAHVRLTSAPDDPGGDAGAPSSDPLAAAGTYDLLAACLRAGMPVSAAAAAVAEQAPEPLGTALRRAANLLALGAEPEIAWQHAGTDPSTEALARLARRSARSGSALADAVTELAVEQRAAVEGAAAAAAERAGVLVSGPLGLCFLPAFLCLGIAPVVIGLATRVLGQGAL
jgi:pilus assembly protein TadC